MNVYESGIIYFYGFLVHRGLNHTPETILEPLTKNEINLYELFDGFVAFLISSGLSIPSIRLYVAQSDPISPTMTLMSFLQGSKER